MLDVSRRLSLLMVLLGLFILKLSGVNSITNDAIMLVIGAIIGKEVISDAKAKVPSET